VFLRHLLQLHNSSALLKAWPAPLKAGPVLLKAGSVSEGKEKASILTVPMQYRMDFAIWFQNLIN
jgi:hypothetical protein